MSVTLGVLAGRLIATCDTCGIYCESYQDHDHALKALKLYHPHTCTSDISVLHGDLSKVEKAVDDAWERRQE